MKIAIIGFGWLGFPLGKSLLAKGHQVIGTTTTEEKITELKKDGLEALQLNLNQDLPQNLNSFFENTDICILNFPPGRDSNPQGLQPIIETYGQHALKAVSLFPEKTRFIFVSSTGVYPDDITHATEAGFDRSAFAATNSMAYAEDALSQQLGERLTVVRMAGLIGGNRHIGKYFAGKKGLPNGNSPVNLIHLTDCIGIIEKIIERNCWGETFNACASEHPSRRDYYTFTCEQFGLEKPEFPMEENPVEGKRIDNEKSKKVLGFTYQYDSPFEMIF